MKLLALTTTLLAGAAFACNQSTTSPPTYENIAGTYTALVSGAAPSGALSATITLAITETGPGTLGGTYSIAGTVSQADTVVQVQDSGLITSGSIAAGTSPAVQFALSVDGCQQNLLLQFSGSYDSATHVLTASGPFYLFTVYGGPGSPFVRACFVNAIYNSVITLNTE
jgi:hypothetical protein